MRYPGGVRNRTTYLLRLASQVHSSQKKLQALAVKAKLCGLHWEHDWLMLMASNVEQIGFSMQRDADANRQKTGPKSKHKFYE